ncbi:MAG: oligopeptidase, partial [Bacilli bacterium]|nr:oligopeptidase [Bacilli bacterium]
MAKTVPLRSELPEDFKWRLEDIYDDNAKWETDFSKLQEVLPSAEAYNGKLESPSQLLALFQLEDELSKIVEKLLTYARMRRDEDNANTYYVGLTDRINTLMSEMQTAFSFVEPE